MVGNDGVVGAGLALPWRALACPAHPGRGKPRPYNPSPHATLIVRYNVSSIPGRYTACRDNVTGSYSVVLSAPPRITQAREATL